MSNAVALSSSNFDTTLNPQSGLVLVDFWASWCGPCMMLGPVIDQLADELDGKVMVCKVNVDEAQDLAQRYGVMSIPTLVLFKNGVEVGREMGVQPKDKLMAFINAQM